MELDMDNILENDEQLEDGVKALNDALRHLIDRNENYNSTEDEEREYDIEMEYRIEDERKAASEQINVHNGGFVKKFFDNLIL